MKYSSDLLNSELSYINAGISENEGDRWSKSADINTESKKKKYSSDSAG